MELAALSMAELVAIHNKLNPTKPATAKTFSQKSKIVSRIESLLFEQGKTVEDLKAKPTTAPLQKALVAAETLVHERQAKKSVGAAESEAKTAAEIPAGTKVKVRLIRMAAEELLLQNDPPLSYPDILAKIKEEFPLGSTSVECLRWYTAQLRERGEKIPDRPRPPRPPKKVEVAPVVETVTA